MSKTAGHLDLRYVRRRLTGVALAILGLSMTGCANNVGPNFVRPDAPGVKQYTASPIPTTSAEVHGAPMGQAQHFTPGAIAAEKWWESLGSPELNALVERSLTANPTIASAEAALRAAHENVIIQRAAALPSVSASVSPSRQRSPASLSPPTASGNSVYNLQTAQVNVGYMIDVFGMNRRAVESLQAQVEAQHYQLRAAQLSLSTNVVVAAIQSAALREQIEINLQLVKSLNEQLQISRRQLELGAIAEAGVIAQEAALVQAKATLPPLQKQLAQTEDQLAALSGTFPGEGAMPRFTLAHFTLPTNLPLSLPSQLVRQRPDILAAEAQLHAASAQIGVATADLYPQLSLSAAVGGTATAFTGIFSAANAFWSMAASLTQPLYQGGALKAKQRVAVAQFDQSFASYKSTVLSAFQNVADVLHALDFDTAALQTAHDAERAAWKSYGIARRQLELGDISYLALLNALSTYQQAKLTLLQAQSNRLADTVALYQALGGGWSMELPTQAQHLSASVEQAR